MHSTSATKIKVRSALFLALMGFALSIGPGCGGGGGSDGVQNIGICAPAQSRKACFDDDVYWYNLCGDRQAVFQYCDLNESCVDIVSEAQCVKTVWAATFGGSNRDGARSVIQTTDGGYIVSGDTDTYGTSYFDFLILKLDSSGNQEWLKTYGNQ